MAEELKTKFTQKVGYQNKIDFDPVKGIMKYGNYEAFIYQIPEIRPHRSVVNFEEWKKKYIESISDSYEVMGHTVYRPLAQQPSDAELRAKFDQSFVTGPVQDSPATQRIMGHDVPAWTPMGAGYRQVKKLGADSYEVNDYFVPQSVDLLYKINQLAMGTTRVTEDTALMREQRETKQARRANANAARAPGAGAAMLGGSAASKALAGG